METETSSLLPSFWNQHHRSWKGSAFADNYRGILMTTPLQPSWASVTWAMICVSSLVQHLTRRRCRKGRDRRRLEPRTSSPRHSGQSVLMVHTFSETSRRVLLIILVPLLRVSRHDTQTEPNPEMSGCHRAAKTPGQVTVQPYKGPGAWASCVRCGTHHLRAHTQRPPSHKAIQRAELRHKDCWQKAFPFLLSVSKKDNGSSCLCSLKYCACLIFLYFFRR